MKQKRQIAILCALVAVAAAVFYFDASPAGERTLRTINGTYPPLAIENPRLRWDKLKASQETEYKSNGRDLFSLLVDPPRAVAAPKRVTTAPIGPVEPPPPVPPKLPVKFYGYEKGPTKRAFLTDGDDIYIVGEGDTLLGKFRILRISNATLEFEEISSGMRGTAPLEEQAAPPA